MRLIIGRRYTVLRTGHYEYIPNTHQLLLPSLLLLVQTWSSCGKQHPFSAQKLLNSWASRIVLAATQKSPPQKSSLSSSALTHVYSAQKVGVCIRHLKFQLLMDSHMIVRLMLSSEWRTLDTHIFLSIGTYQIQMYTRVKKHRRMIRFVWW